MTDVNEWQGKTGDSWAAEWRRTDRTFTMLTEELLRRTRGAPCTQVLDIGCGAGELSLALARGRPDSKIIGVDISPQLNAVARARGARLENVDFVVADAAQWQPPAGFAPDFLISRHGVMFFDQPESAFANLAQIAAPHAKLLFSCFRTPAENPIFTEVARLLPEQPEMGPPGPGPFAFADSEKVQGILTAGGWTDVVFTPFDLAMVVGGGEDSIEDAVSYFGRIGPTARAMSEMDEDSRKRFLERLRRMAQNNCRDNLVMLPAAVWIVTASKA